MKVSWHWLITQELELWFGYGPDDMTFNVSIWRPHDGQAEAKLWQDCCVLWEIACIGSPREALDGVWRAIAGGYGRESIPGRHLRRPLTRDSGAAAYVRLVDEFDVLDELVS